MLRRNAAAQPAKALSAPSSTVPTSTAPTKKARLIRNLVQLSDVHLAVIVILQIDKYGNVIAKRPLEFELNGRIVILTKVAFRAGGKGSEKWILSLRDPETGAVEDIVRERPPSSALDRARAAFLNQNLIADRHRQRLPSGLRPRQTKQLRN